MSEKRPLLGAVVGPLAAAYMDRELGPALRRMARDLAALGQVDAARQLSSAASQLREAARQLRERTSAPGSAEVPQPAGRAESVSPPGPTEWWSTEVAAAELDVTARQVRNLAHLTRLTAVTTGGRMLIDPLSVIAEQQRRRGDEG